jgi:hypothetical protein
METLPLDFFAWKLSELSAKKKQPSINKEELNEEAASELDEGGDKDDFPEAIDDLQADLKVHFDLLAAIQKTFTEHLSRYSQAIEETFVSCFSFSSSSSSFSFSFSFSFSSDVC